MEDDALLSIPILTVKLQHVSVSNNVFAVSLFFICYRLFLFLLCSIYTFEPKLPIPFFRSLKCIQIALFSIL